MRYLMGIIAMTVLLASCAWDNSPPPLHSRIRMKRSATGITVAAATEVTNFNRGADFDTNKLQGAGGAPPLHLPPSSRSSRGAASASPSVNPAPATGVLGGTSTDSGIGSPSPQPSTLNPPIAPRATNPTSGSGTNSVP